MRRGIYQRGTKYGRTRIRRLWALLIAFMSAAALFAFFLPPGRAGTDSFIVVDTKVLAFDAKNCYETVNISGSKLVFISHFALADSDIGLTTSYDPAKRYFSLACAGKTITFEIGSSVAFDSEKQYSQRCTLTYIDGDTVFMLPLDFLQDYFDDWNFNITKNTEYGDMLRITTRKISMSDKDFLTYFDDRLREAWLDANPTPTPSPSYPGFVTPSASPAWSPSPSAPAASPSQAPVPISVYITFEGGPNELTREFMDILDLYGMPAAFFMRGEQMADYPSEMRRIAASPSFTAALGGYDGPEEFSSSPEKTLSAINADNEALYACTLTKTMLIRVPGGSGMLSDEMSRELIMAGYRYWDWTVDATSETAGGKVYDTVFNQLKALLSEKEPDSCVLMLSQDGETLEAMDKILNYLSDSRFTVQRLGDSLSPKNSRKDQCTLDSLKS